MADSELALFNAALRADHYQITLNHENPNR
jgi:hypothetical protein